jgi:dihydrofolate synthase/folylpolyglutamate synthase
MEYAEALEWLYGLSARGMRFELDRMRGAVAERGHPEAAVPVVHVAGTNGKGSVCAMVEQGLRQAGYRTGRFASPHLHRFAERVMIGGTALPEAEVAERLTEIRAALPGLPRLTFFEVSALIAFEAFRDHRCDIAVVEVGLGGRLDATNVVDDPRVSVITRIAKDHTKILGDTLGAIAHEKAGILRRGVPAVIGAREPEARKAIAAELAKRGTDAWWIGEDFDGAAVPFAEPPPLDAPGRARVRIGEREEEVALGLRGEFQAENAAIAWAALERLDGTGFPVPSMAIRKGLPSADWPGRLEVVRDAGRCVVFDCGHNPDGCAAVAAFLARRELPGPVVLLFGAMADKDHEGMLAPFDPFVDERIYAIPRMPRAPEDPSVFTAIRPGRVASSVSEGLALAREAAGKGGTVLVAGSIFLVQAARAEVLQVRSDPPIAM